MFEKLREKIINNKLKFCVSLLAFAIIISGIVVTINNTGNTYAVDLYCDDGWSLVSGTTQCCPNGFLGPDALGKCYDDSSTATECYEAGGTFDTRYLKCTITAKEGKYLIQFDSNGGSAIANMKVGKNESIKLPVVTRQGYTFKGWKDTAGKTYAAQATYTVTTNETFTAEWEKNEATGYACYKCGSTQGEMYVWGLNSVYQANQNCLLQSQYSSELSCNNASNTYTVRYYANGGSGAPASQVANIGESLKLSSTKPTKDGYTFMGWSTSSSATVATYKAGSTFEGSQSNEVITLYAVWYTCWKCHGGGSSFNYAWAATADTSKCVMQTDITSETSCNAMNVYTVKYDANGGTGAPSMQTAQVGESLKLSSTKPTKAGYTFMGWSTNASATVATYNAGSTFEGSQSNEVITLYAIWYTCWKCHGGGDSFNYAWAATADESKCVRQEELKTESQCLNSSSGDSGDSGNTGDSSNPSVTKYTIKYDANGGKGAPAEQSKVKGTDLTLSTTVPTREGYTFLGWNTDKNATEASYKSGAVYSADENVTLYAIWKQDDTVLNTYTISYDANGGSNAPASQSKTHGVNVALSTQIPTRDGYTFLGWNTDKNAKTALYKSGAVYSADENVTLYAIWEENSKEDEDIKDNIPTGDILIGFAWLIGLGALGYSVYYFRTRKMDI